MSQCGVNISLDSLVEAIIDNYGDAFATEIIRRLDGCKRDNHTTKFYIDKEKDHLVIKLKFGERYYVSRAEFESWLKLSGISDSPYIVSGVFIERDGGYWLDFTRNDNTKVNVDMTDSINKIIKTVFDMVMSMGYRINTQAEDYTLTGDDFNGRTIVRADKDGDQVITIPKPESEDFVGKAIIIRKTSGEAGTFVTLNKGDGVSILPEDATPVRRVGSSVTLVYVGDGVYDVFGELP